MPLSKTPVSDLVFTASDRFGDEILKARLEDNTERAQAFKDARDIITDLYCVYLKRIQDEARKVQAEIRAERGVS